MSKKPSESCTALCLGLLLVLGAVQTRASTEPLFHDRTDGELEALVTSLLPEVERHGSDEDVALLHLQQTTHLHATSESYRLDVNRILYLRSGASEEAFTRIHRALRGESIVSAGGWIRRADGTLERLTERDVRIDRTGENGPSEVVFAFPRMEPGDVFGWSLRVESSQRLNTRLFMLDAEEPVARGLFLISTDGRVGYSIRGRNLPSGSFESEVLEETNGNASRIVCRVTDLPARRSEVLSPPWRRVRSHIAVNLKGEYLEEEKMWFAVRSWNWIALNYEDFIAEATEVNKDVLRRAEEITRGLQDDLARADALFRFVRDEIVLLSAWERPNFVKPQETLKSEAGDSLEKAFLFTALAKSLDIPVRLGFARNRFEGPLEHDDPGFWQFTDALALLHDEAGNEVWYVPGVAGTPVRTLPSGLRGVEVAFFSDQLATKNKRMWQRAYAAVGVEGQRLIADYLRRMRAETWAEFVTTSGNPHEVLGSVTEVRVLDLENESSVVSLHTKGITTQGHCVLSGGDAAECAVSYADDRGLGSVDVASVALRTDDDEDEFELSWQEALDPRPRTPDVWVLPPEVTFAKPVLSFWTGPDRGPIFIEAALEQTYRTEIPLPDGWTVRTDGQSLKVFNPLFRYECTISVTDDRLQIERRIQWKAVELGRESMAMIDGDVRRIHAHETRTLVAEPISADAGSTTGAKGR